MYALHHAVRIEGLGVGCFVELVSLIRRPGLDSGSRLSFQSSIKRKNLDFELIASPHLIFDFLSVNGLPEMERDTTMADKNRWSFSVDEMPIFKAEELSHLGASVQYLIYKLKSNTVSGNFDLYSYGEAAKYYYSYIYENVDKADLKAISGLIKASGISKTMTDREKIATFENYMKTNYVIVPYAPQEYKKISFIKEKKISRKIIILE